MDTGVRRTGREAAARANNVCDQCDALLDREMRHCRTIDYLCRLYEIRLFNEGVRQSETAVYSSTDCSNPRQNEAKIAAASFLDRFVVERNRFVGCGMWSHCGKTSGR